MLALSGDTLVIRESSLAVLAYVRGQTGWVLQQKLPVQAGGDFGHAVAIDGDGSSFRSGEIVNRCPCGAVYVYDCSAAIWSSPTHLIAPDILQDDNFGSSIALRGDTLIVGAVWNLGGGAATPARNGKLYVFTKDGDSWPARRYLARIARPAGSRHRLRAVRVCRVGRAGLHDVFWRHAYLRKDGRGVGEVAAIKAPRGTGRTITGPRWLEQGHALSRPRLLHLQFAIGAGARRRRRAQHHSSAGRRQLRARR